MQLMEEVKGAARGQIVIFIEACFPFTPKKACGNVRVQRVRRIFSAFFLYATN